MQFISNSTQGLNRNNVRPLLVLSNIAVEFLFNKESQN